VLPEEEGGDALADGNIVKKQSSPNNKRKS